jgi:nicotinamidase-related amidase
VGLLLVDCQNTLCTPGFELFVPERPTRPAAVEIVITWRIKDIPTLDTHRACRCSMPPGWST